MLNKQEHKRRNSMWFCTYGTQKEAKIVNNDWHQYILRVLTGKEHKIFSSSTENILYPDPSCG